MLHNNRNSVKVLGATIILLLIASRATAQGVIVSPYVQPAGGNYYYYPAPTTTYYAPPVATYYYPAPAPTYYAAPAVSYNTARVAYYPTPSVSYYTAPAVYYNYYPSTVTTTRYGIFGQPRVTTYYYPGYIGR